MDTYEYKKLNLKAVNMKIKWDTVSPPSGRKKLKCLKILELSEAANGNIQW